MTCAHLTTCKRDKTRNLEQWGKTQQEVICDTRDEAESRTKSPLCLLNTSTAEDHGAFFPEDHPRIYTLYTQAIPPATPEPEDRDKQDSETEPEEEEEPEAEEDG